MNTEHQIIYVTGYTTDGTPVIGGLWKLWEQEGFPLEMAYLVCRDSGWAVDWMEAMADASRTNNLPSLVKQMGAFLTDEALMAIKAGFAHAVAGGKTFDDILNRKRENAAKIARQISLSEKTKPEPIT